MKKKFQLLLTTTLTITESIQCLSTAKTREINASTADRWYRCMFFNLRLEMEAYLRYEKAFERIVSGCPMEDCEDGMEYNEEWENEEYDPDEV